MRKSRPEIEVPLSESGHIETTADGRTDTARKSGWPTMLIELTRVRISAMVTLTTATGYLLASGRFDAGMSSAQVAVNRPPDHFSGIFAELGVGLRYFFSSKVGLFFELGGSVVQLSLDEDSSNKVVLLRLQSNLGLVVGW